MKKLNIKKCYPYTKYRIEHPLNLCNNKISNISSLKNLVNLKELNLSNNRITDISPLKNLVNLKELNLSNNPIPQQRIEELWKVLPNCEIGY